MTDDRHDLPEPDDPIEKGLQELQRQADELKVESKGDQIDAEFDERMKRLEARVQESKAVRESQQRETKRQLASDRESARGLGVGLSIAYTIIGLPLFGYAVGYFIDQSTGGESAKGIAMMIGAVAGIGMAFVILNRQNN